MKLEPTRVEQTYEVEGEGGYRFQVVAEFDPEWGWAASVTMSTRGLKTSAAAVLHLAGSAKAFLDMVAASPRSPEKG